MSGIAGVVVLLLVAILCVLPALVACNRRHWNMTPILILNLFLGWVVIFSTALTIVGWVVLLAWSFSSHVRPKPIPRGAQHSMF